MVSPVAVTNAQVPSFVLNRQAAFAYCFCLLLATKTAQRLSFSPFRKVAVSKLASSIE